MVIFTRGRKLHNNIFSYLGRFSFLVLLFSFSVHFLNAQQVTEVVTDFGGYWRSGSTSLNSTRPNDSHNVLAFKAGTEFYSTGVNNAILNNKGLTYTTGNFKALPITSITGTVTSGSPIYIALAGNYDGVPNGYSNPLPNVRMKDVLTDGINGLNIGTGTTNIPSSAIMTFPVESIDANSITDEKPDILYTQIADPSASNDVLYFVNASGVMVGSSVAVNWSTVPSLGTYILDLYNLQAGATCDNAVITSGFNINTTRNIRLTALKLSDFGITAANKASVTSLIVKPGGESDPAFVAYNTDAFVISPPEIVEQPQTQIVCTGTNQKATFSVTATGTGNTYQWKKNGVNIPGATGTTYIVDPVTAADAGTYEVIVTNSSGTAISDRAYLNTTIISQPSPTAQTVVTGNTVTLSVSATNATSYQWKKNGVNIASATNSVYTIDPLTTADAGAYTVSAINSASSCATVLSNPAVITPVIVVYSKSTGDINKPATWGANANGSGSTPVNFTRAEHTFVLSNRASGNTLTNLTIAGTLDVSNGEAIIADNTTLDVGKCIRTGTGSVSGSANSGLTVRGNSALYFTPNKQILKSFTITGGTVSMLSPLTISGGDLPGKLNLTGGTLALGSNKITLSSTSTTNTSMVTAVGAGASITYGTGGAFIVERFIPAKRSFRFISPAVTTTTSIKTNWMEGVTNPDRWNNINPLPGYGTHITGPRTPADSLDMTQTYNPSLFYFLKNTQSWKAAENSAATLTAGQPVRLMVRGSRAVDLNNNDATPSNTILRTTGSLTTGTYNVGSDLLSSAAGTYSFIGNPYASPVSWSKLTKSGISNTYYTWDETLNKRGAYVAYNDSAKSNSNSTSAVDENIQSEQAFFVQVTSASPLLQFKETDKTGTNTSVFRGSNTMAKLSVQLLLNANEGSDNAADGFTAVFSDDFSKELGGEDSYKFSNLDENMAISRNGTSLSIEGRPTVTTADTLPLKIWQLRQKSYLLKLTGSNFSPSLRAIVKDEYLQEETAVNLSSSTLLPFTISADPASSAENRFSIIFESYATLPVNITGIKAYQKDKGIQVEWNALSETNIEKYEVEKSLNGQQFDKMTTLSAKNNNIAVQAYSCFDANPGDGNNFYRIKIIEKSGAIKYSEIVRVNVSNDNNSFTVSPNPVKDGVVSLHLQNQKKGKYVVNVYNSTGQKVYSSSIEHTGGSASQTITLGKNLSPGKYSLQLNNDETTLSQSIIIQ